jgi:hypothetical protein
MHAQARDTVRTTPRATVRHRNLTGCDAGSRGDFGS